MYLANIKEAIKLETLTAERAGSTFALMERIGVAVAEYADRALRSGSRISVVCGSGNNAGDGLVAARVLKRKNHQVKIVACSCPDKWRGDALAAFKMLKQHQPDVQIMELADQSNHKQFENNLSTSNLVIDAVFGTGLSRDVEGIERFVIDAINKYGKAVFSVDIPSGIHADTGRILGAAVKADATLAAGIVKLGAVLYPGAKHSGKIEILDMGTNAKDINNIVKTKTITENMVSSWLPKREPDVHKKSTGKIGVLAGSAGMGGAAYLSSMGALKSGAGIVYLFCPKSLAVPLQAKLTEVVLMPLPEGNAGSLSSMAARQIQEFSKDLDVIVLGPGLSIRPETVTLVRQLVSSLDLPLVIDADGLNALAGQPSLLKERTKPTVITPHHGEMARLIGKEIEDVENDRIATALETAFDLRSVVVLKGARTIISSPNQNCYLTMRGNPGMATAGTGDVLSGMIGGFIGQSVEPFTASALAADLHAHSGDFAKEALSEYYMTALNLLDYLPSAFKYYENRKVKE